KFYRLNVPDIDFDGARKQRATGAANYTRYFVSIRSDTPAIPHPHRAAIPNGESCRDIHRKCWPIDRVDGQHNALRARLMGHLQRFADDLHSPSLSARFG